MKTNTAATQKNERKLEARYVPLTELMPDPDQPRTEISRVKTPGDGSNDGIDSLDELTESVRIHGIIEPLIARKNPNGPGYIIVAGHRRLAAAKGAGREDAPVVIVSGDLVENAGSRAVMQIVENLHRDEMNGLEIGNAVIRLRNELGMSQKDIAVLLRRSESTISRWATAASVDSRDYLEACGGQPATLELFRGLDEITRETALRSFAESKQPFTQQEIRKIAVYAGLKGAITKTADLKPALEASLDDLKVKDIERKNLAREAAQVDQVQVAAAPRSVTGKIGLLNNVDAFALFSGVESDQVAPQGSLKPGVGTRIDYAGLDLPDFSGLGSTPATGERPQAIKVEFTVMPERAKQLLLMLGKSDEGSDFELGARLRSALMS